MQKNVERHWSERVGFLGPDKCLTGQLHLDLRNLPGDSNDEDRLPIYKKRDKNMEISKGKSATTTLNALQQLSWPH